MTVDFEQCYVERDALLIHTEKVLALAFIALVNISERHKQIYDIKYFKNCIFKTRDLMAN